MIDDSNLKRREEEKRDRAWNPVERWRLIQETITWAEANLPPEQRRNRPRTHAANSPGRTALATNAPAAKLDESPVQSDRR